VKILTGDNRKTLKTIESGTVQTCVTSPPYYGLRDYGMPDQIGLEETPEIYVEKLVQVFREVWRVLKDDGTLWLNLGDSYANSGKGGNPAGSDWSGFVGNNEREKSAMPRAMKAKDIGLKPKDLIGIPWMVAFALRADGWYLRSDIIWHKPNPMPESVTDRPTKSHEYIFLMSKSAQYYYDHEAIQEIATGYDGRKDTKYKGSKKYENSGQTNARVGGERWKYKNLKEDGQQPNTMHLNRLVGDEYVSPVRNKRSVWTVTTKPYSGAHFATFPPDLIEPCILAGSKAGDIVLDPFSGSGTTGAVSLKHHRDYIGCELNPDYVELTNKRFSNVQPVLMGTL
jgi:DNA modification methylase